MSKRDVHEETSSCDICQTDPSVLSSDVGQDNALVNNWQDLARRRCSRPSILVWYLRVGSAGLVAYAAFRRGWIRWLTQGRARRFAMLATAIAYRLLRRQKQIFPGGATDWEGVFAQFKSARVPGRFVTRDGVEVAYTTMGSGSKIVLLANGLGCRDIYFVQTLMYFDSIGAHTEYMFVTWDYRGLFMSGDLPANRTVKFSIRDHAEDGLELLNALGCERCHAAVGWSTGVQVVLEMASIRPEKIDRLILLNGAHGHVFQNVLQPIVHVPGLSKILHILAQLVRRTTTMRRARTFYTKCLPAFRLCVLRPSFFFLGLNYESFFYQYLVDVVKHGERHTTNYFKLAECLDAHSSYHTLNEIKQPALIITGMLDVLTPAYHSFEMASLMPNARLICYNLGSHFCALEYPQDTAQLCELFLQLPPVLPAC